MPEQLVRYFHPYHSDLDVIRTLRDKRNRLGCAVKALADQFHARRKFEASLMDSWIARGHENLLTRCRPPGLAW
jgi:hypothetical protein